MDNNNAEFNNLDDACKEVRSLRRALTHKDRDIRILTHYNEQAERLRRMFENEKKLQYLYNDLLLANTPNMLFVFNEDLEYVLGSRVCRRLTRQDHRSLLRRPLPLVFSADIDASWVENIHRLNRQALETLVPVQLDDSIPIVGEPDMHIRLAINPIVDDNGTCRGTIMTIVDVSELVVTRRRAEEAAKSKASFLANMSHEIRTPMNAIKGLSELLALTTLNDTQANYVNNIISSANSLIGVINDVLDFSKIDANRIELLPAPYSLHKLLSEISSVIGLRAEEKGLTFFVDIDPGVPSRLVGDDARIKQILLNLLSNAIKYTPSGHVVFRITAEWRSDRHIALSCSVEDTGVGIKEEDAANLFDVYSRVDIRVNRGIQGTGLGLAISKRLAGAMGGDVSLQSTYGKGSVFTLTIPQEVDQALPLASVAEPEKLKVLLAGSDSRMRNARDQLERLGVAAAFLDDSGSDVGLARKLSRVNITLPVCGDPEQPYTHCLYTDILPEREVMLLRTRLPGCRLAVLRSIITSMEDPGTGDTMLFNPLLITELAKFLNKSGSRTAGASTSSDTAVAHRLRVRNARALVVDDNRINLMVCEKMLDLHGVEVATAPGGTEALELCMKEKFDILFVDHMMPGMDGIEVTTEIRGRPGPNRETPIVALTANVVNDMRSHYIKCGMDDFIGKPIDRSEIVRVLLHWLPPDKIERDSLKTPGKNQAGVS